MSKRIGLLAHLKRTISSRRRASQQHRLLSRLAHFESLESRQLLDGASLGSGDDQKLLADSLVGVAPVATDDWAVTDAGKLVTIDVLSNDTDADGTIDPASLKITTTPTRGYWGLDGGKVIYTPGSTFSGTDTFKYQVKDNDGNWSNEATVTVACAESLQVDLTQEASLNLKTGGDRFYHLNTTQAGLLTAQANFDPASGTVVLSLHDSSYDPGNPDASRIGSPQNRRIDLAVGGAGESYYLQVSGTNTAVSLVLANLYNVDAGANVVTVYGTSRDDQIEIAATAVAITDVEGDYSIQYDFQQSPSSLTFQDTQADDSDSAVLWDTAAHEDVGIEQVVDGWKVTGLAFPVTLLGVAETAVVSSGGDDTAVLNGTSESDVFTGSFTQATMSGTGYRHTVQGFKAVTAVAGSGGSDVASFSDTSGDETFTAGPTSAELKSTSDPDQKLSTSNFTEIHVSASQGGHDVATVTGTEGNDKLTASLAGVKLEGPEGSGFSIEATGFDEVTVDAGAGDADEAAITDSSASDTLTASPTSVKLEDTASALVATANGFDTIEVTAGNGGTDEANLSGSSGTDTFTFKAVENEGTLAAGGCTIVVTQFAEIHVEGGQDDVTHLYDGAGNDAFTSTPGKVTFSGDGYLVEASSFKYAHAYSRNGGSDTADFEGSAGADALKSTWWDCSSRLTYADGSLARAKSFKTVTVDGKGGNDELRLDETEGNDVFTLKPTQVALNGSGYSIAATNFEHSPNLGYIQVNASKYTGDSDSVDFYDGDSDDTFTAYPSVATLKVAGVKLEACQFAKVNAHSDGSGDDRALLYGSSGKDTLSLTLGGANFFGGVTGTTFSMIVSGFVSISGRGRSGLDTATITGSSGDDSLQASAGTAILTGSGFASRAAGFDTITVNGDGGDDTATFEEAAGRDFLTARSGTFFLRNNGDSVTANQFEHLEATLDRSDTDRDVVSLCGTSGDETLTVDPTQAKLTGTGWDAVVTNAFKVLAYGEGGADVANLSGSTAKDTFVFQATANEGTFTTDGCTIVVTQFAETHLDGGQDDSAEFFDSTGNESFSSKPGVATFSGTGYLVEVNSFTAVHAYATQGGSDTAAFEGSADDDTFAFTWDGRSSVLTYADQSFARTKYFKTVTVDGKGGDDDLRLGETKGNDTFTLKPDQVALSGSGYSIQATKFEHTGELDYIQVSASKYSSDSDTVDFYDGDSDDVFTAYPDKATMTVAGVTREAIQFAKVNAHSDGDGRDRAILCGSSGKDTLNLTLGGAEFSGGVTGSTFAVTASGFVSIIGYGRGGLDTATITGSSGDDTLEASAGTATLTDSEFRRTASNFDTITVTGGEGDDTVTFNDADGRDFVAATSDAMTVRNSGNSVVAKQFEHLEANLDQADKDVASLYDNSGDNTLEASSTEAKLTGNDLDYLVKNAASVYVYANAGGTDKATLTGSDGDDEVNADSTKVALRVANCLIEAAKFDEVTVEAKEGDADTANLKDSSGDDTFTARPAVSKLEGTGYLLTVKAFDYVHAFAEAGGTDTAKFYESDGDDTFTGKPDISAMKGVGYSNDAKAFDKVFAYADSTSGDNDVADLYDSAGGDLFTAEETKATLASHVNWTVYSYEVNSFNHITVYGTTGENLYDIAKHLDYTYDLLGSWSEHNP
jgi:hypothetical protein